MTNPDTNPIGFLQEICQKHGYGFPQYEYLGDMGPSHCPEFTVRCQFQGLEALGISRQKKQAKSEAAKAIVDLLRKGDHDIIDRLPLQSDSVYSNAIKAEEKHTISSASKNPISAINEYCQTKKIPLPEYVETTAHGGSFVCECHVDEHKTYGYGSNKKTAKTEAALKMSIQLKISCVGTDLVEQSNSYEDIKFSKNCISLLQEKCAANPKLKNPEYTDLPSIMRVFVVRCTVNSVSCDGSGPTKKDAKFEAARKVLLALQNQNFDKQDLPQFSELPRLPKTLNTGALKSVISPSEHTSLTYQLDDFKLSDDEEQNEKNTIVDVDLTLGIKEMKLEPRDELKKEKSEETSSISRKMQAPNIFRNKANLKSHVISTEQASFTWMMPASLTIQNVNLTVNYHVQPQLPSHFNFKPNLDWGRSPKESSSLRIHKTKTSESLARWARQD